MNQIQWTYNDEIAPIFPNHAPIQTLCALIDSNQAKGRKADDLKEQLLKWSYQDGTTTQFLHVHDFIEGGF